jgi:DNA polymerase II large subunit
MDAPLVLTTIVDPQEVDNEVWQMDTAWKLPLKFYYATYKYADADSVKIPRVSDHLKNPLGQGFSHPTSQMDKGPVVSSYKTLGAMLKKVEAQLELGRKIRAVDENNEAEILISSHFIKDIKGNIRTYCRQSFRCTSCNKIYRRIPLIGKCGCGGNIVLTVAQGSVEKYLKPSQMIAEKFQISNYMKQELSILDRKLKAMFGKEKETQTDLSGFLKK